MASSGRGSRKTAGLPVVAVLLALVSLCTAPVIRLPQLPEAGDASLYEKKWRHYGAYYDKKESILTTRILNYSCYTKFSVDYDLRILTNEGAKYGTIPVYRYSSTTVSVFEPQLINKDNQTVPLDKKGMLRTYKETGKVVFPKVEKGSRIRLRMELFNDTRYYSSLLYHFENDIPVRIGRFVHIRKQADIAMYGYKTYGSRYRLTYDSRAAGSSDSVFSWVLKEYEPRGDDAFQPYRSVTEPRVAVRLLKVPGWQKEYNSRQEVFSDYLHEIKGVHADIDRFPETDTVCKKVTASEPDEERLARAVQRWLQTNLRKTDDDENKPSNVITQAKATYLQTACLGRAMFKTVKIRAEIVFAFDKNIHLMDTSVLFENVNMTPLLVARIKNRPVVLYPHEVGYEPGDYPLCYNGVFCIKPESKKIKRLPPPLWGSKRIGDRLTVDCRKGTPKCRLRREYRETSAAMKRSYIHGMDEEGLKSDCRSMIKELNAANRLISHSYSGLDSVAGPLRVDMDFESDELLGPLGNDAYFITMSSLMRPYFEKIAPDRAEDIVVDEKTTYSEEIVVFKLRDKTIDCDVRASAMKNELFSSTLTKNETDSAIVINRTITVNPVTIGKDKIAAICKECAAFDEVRKTVVVFWGR